MPPPNDDIKCCAKCGARQSADKKLQRCSRCLLVKYCSPECQKSDWKRHKRMECNTTKLPAGASHDALTMSEEDVAASKIRPVCIAEPKNILCACWCCGMLLKVCGDKGQNPTNDKSGPFWTSTFGRDEATPPVKGKTFPALWILGEPGSTGFSVGVNNWDQGAACIYCATELQHEDGKHAEKHIQKCEGYLYDPKLHQALKKGELVELSAFEKRMIARISIDPDPNLSYGAQSIAGYMKKEGNKKKKIAVSYDYRGLEHLAFPFLLNEAAEYGGKGTELEHYTRMRLYSADKAWRNDMDYVSFSLLRLAANGHDGARDILQQLPKPLPASKLATCEIEVIGIL